MKLCLISLGCNKNLVDSEVMLGKLRNYELTSEPNRANVVIINTCGFIDSAKQESVARILEVASVKKKDSILIVSGCLSARYAQELKSEIPEIDIIIGVGDYANIDTILNRALDSKNVRLNLADSNIARKNGEVFLIDREERVITGSRIHAYIKISEGCNQQCSFCAIPQIKGKLRSRSIESIVREVEVLLKKGYQDFSFIAQDSSSFLRDMGKKDALIDLIDEVEKTGIKSARILYLYPSTTSAKLIAKISESSVFAPYFDMPIQHISDFMLKTMKRGRDKRAHIELLRLMREAKNSFIRTTFLIGHPKESDRDFEELMEFISDFSFDRANIFAFSAQEGTAAFDMREKVKKDLIDSRIDKINEVILRQQREKFAAMKKTRAIIEGKSEKSEFLYLARDWRWAPEIDGEILINENLTPSALSAGYYDIEITQNIEEKSERFLLAKAIKRCD